VARPLLLCVEAPRSPAESHSVELLTGDHAFGQEVPICTVSLYVSFRDSRGKATEKHSVLTLPCRELFQKLPSLPSAKKGSLPKGNGSCQTTSYQNPSRWNLYFKATLCPEEPCYRAGGTDLGGTGKVFIAPACLLLTRAEAPLRDTQTFCGWGQWQCNDRYENRHRRRH